MCALLHARREHGPDRTQRVHWAQGRVHARRSSVLPTLFRVALATLAIYAVRTAMSRKSLY